MRIILAVVLVLALGGMGAAAQQYAQQHEEKMALATQLAKLQRMDAMQDAVVVLCQKNIASAQLDPVAILANNPSAFGGITPTSAYWPELKASYRAYQDLLCDPPDTEALNSATAQGYADNGSIETLRAAVDFFSSPAGQQYVEMYRLALPRQMAVTMSAKMRSAQAAAEKLQQQTQRLMAAYRADPK